jgi:hypothetical protein
MRDGWKAMRTTRTNAHGMRNEVEASGQSSPLPKEKEQRINRQRSIKEVRLERTVSVRRRRKGRWERGYATSRRGNP